MKIKLIVSLICALLIITLSGILEFGNSSEAANTRTLTEDQLLIADSITTVCINKWDDYGVLPSVCIAQGFIESTLGEHCPSYNLWGIRSGAVTYKSLNEGINAYLKVINNGYYEGAPFCKDNKTQLKRILDGGYCVPVGNYYANASWVIDAYNLDSYDQKLFKVLKERKKELRLKKAAEKRAKEQQEEFTVVYDSSIPENFIVADSKVIKDDSTVCVYVDYCMIGIYESVSGSEDHILKSGNKDLDGKKVTLYVYENAKG